MGSGPGDRAYALNEGSAEYISKRKKLANTAKEGEAGLRRTEERQEDHKRSKGGWETARERTLYEEAEGGERVGMGMVRTGDTSAQEQGKIGSICRGRGR